MIILAISKIKDSRVNIIIVCKVILIFSFSVYFFLDIPKMWPNNFYVFHRLPDNRIESLPYSHLIESMIRFHVFYEYRDDLSGKIIKHQNGYPINHYFFSLARMKSEITNTNYFIRDFASFKENSSFIKFPGRTNISCENVLAGKSEMLSKFIPSYFLLKNDSMDFYNSYVMIPFDHNYYLIPEEVYNLLLSK